MTVQNKNYSLAIPVCPDSLETCVSVLTDVVINRLDAPVLKVYGTVKKISKNISSTEDFSFR